MNRWTPSEDAIIRDNWRTMTDLQLSDLLPERAVTAIHQHRAIDLGINRRKPPAYPENYAPNRYGLKFRHGTTPANPISREFIEAIDEMRIRAGTYNDGRARYERD